MFLRKIVMQSPCGDKNQKNYGLTLAGGHYAGRLEATLLPRTIRGRDPDFSEGVQFGSYYRKTNK